jgi:hypothetical protein
MQYHIFSLNTIKCTVSICENIKLSYIIGLVFIVPEAQMSLLLETSVGLAVRIFPATTRTFTKETALSQNGWGAAWHVWINAAGHGKGTAWERHGRGIAAAWHVWISLNTVADTARFVYRLNWSPLWVEISTLAYEANLIVDQYILGDINKTRCLQLQEGPQTCLL